MDSTLDGLLKLSLKTTLAYAVFISFFFGTNTFQQEILAKSETFQRLTSEYYRAVISSGTLRLETVRTSEERAKGLSGREIIDSDLGLLFVFPESDYHGIWMKDMNFPIDILWLDAGYFLVDYQKNVSPDTFPTVFKPNKPARYVLEVNAGFIDKNFIKIGDQLNYY